MDRDVLYSGKHGECSWDIEKDGTMLVYPTNGERGYLSNTCDFPDDRQDSPWLEYADSIKEVKVLHGVSTNAFAGRLFADLKECEKMDLSGLNTSYTATMDKMFENCEKLQLLNVASFNTHDVEVMSEMFSNCKSLKNLDLSSFDTGNVVSMYRMFNNCESLKSLNLSNFSQHIEADWTHDGRKAQYAVDMKEMFAGCKNLSNLDMSRIDFEAPEVDIDKIFIGANKSLKDRALKSVHKSKSCFNVGKYISQKVNRKNLPFAIDSSIKAKKQNNFDSPDGR